MPNPMRWHWVRVYPPTPEAIQRAVEVHRLACRRPALVVVRLRSDPVRAECPACCLIWYSPPPGEPVRRGAPQARSWLPVGVPRQMGMARLCADRAAMPRPCPEVGCRHHLHRELQAQKRATLSALMPDGTARPTCSLDVAEAAPLDGLLLDEIADLLLITRERVRQIEEQARRKILARAAEGDRAAADLRHHWRDVG